MLPLKHSAILLTCIKRLSVLKNSFCLLFQGCHGQGKNSGKRKKFQVREKSWNFIFSQGNLEKMKKVMEKSGNFKIFLKGC